MSAAMNPLIGKTLTAIYLSNDGHAIKFIIKDSRTPIIARTEGDCCSVTWIENVEAPDAAVGSRVLSVRDLEMREPIPDHPEHDCLQFYGLAITTAKGTCTIDYRNSSNGYYGGNLSWPDDAPGYYEGVFNQNVYKDEWHILASTEINVCPQP